MFFSLFILCFACLICKMEARQFETVSFYLKDGQRYVFFLTLPFLAKYYFEVL